MKMHTFTTWFRTDITILVVISIVGCSTEITEATEPQLCLATYLTQLYMTVLGRSMIYFKTSFFYFLVLPSSLGIKVDSAALYVIKWGVSVEKIKILYPIDVAYFSISVFCFSILTNLPGTSSNSVMPALCEKIQMKAEFRWKWNAPPRRILKYHLSLHKKQLNTVPEEIADIPNCNWVGLRTPE